MQRSGIQVTTEVSRIALRFIRAIGLGPFWRTPGLAGRLPVAA
jgi:hypothetical protein